MSTEIPQAKCRTPPTKRKPRSNKLSKEQILFALKKKKECNARAQQVVEDSLDAIAADKIPNFLANLIHINQSHFDDIVEERAIMKMCGYPPCDMVLDEVPRQQYRISLAKTKIYDITERKKFCSNKCYKSSIYLKEQLLTTPLWIRKEDDAVPEFKLLTFESDDSESKD